MEQTKYLKSPLCLDTTKLYDILSPIVEVMFALLDFTIVSPTRARIRASAVLRFLLHRFT